MMSSFRPLYAFLKLALQPIFWSYITPAANAGGNAFNGISVARYPFEAARDRHQLAPEGHMAFIQQAWNPAHAPFEPRPVFEVAYVDAYGYVWVAKNSHARSMPPPPDRNGPVLCSCGAPANVGVAPRYNPSRGGDAWACPDQYSGHAASRAFSLDLFSGAGPCAARDEDGFLAQWDPTWAERAENGDWVFSEDFEGHSTVVETSDALIAAAVNVPFRALDPDVRGSLSAEDLRRAWSNYVMDVLRRRADIMEALVSQGHWQRLKGNNDPAWRELQTEGWLKAGCVGAWFKDPFAYLDVLRDYYRRGLPVFYPWSEELGRRAPELVPSDALRDLLRPMYDQLLPIVNVPEAAPTVDHPPAPSTPPTPPPVASGSADAPPAANARDRPAVTTRAVNEPRAPDARGPDAMEEDDIDASDAFSEAVWNRLARELDAQEAEALPAAAVEAPPPPYRPMPMEGRDFFIVPGAALRLQDADDVTIAPCRRASLYISRLVESEADFLSSAGRPRSRTTLNAIAVVLPALLRRMEPLPTPAFAEDVHLVVYDGTLVLRALEYAIRHGLVTDRTELVDFLIDNGIRFCTGVPVLNPEPLLTNPWHGVPAGPWFDEAGPVTLQFQQWADRMEALLEKPHVARAALARGGIVSMAVRALVDVRFPLKPTSPTLEHGSPQSCRYRHLTLYDDYLTDDEVKLILGYPNSGAQRSLLPSVAAFNDSYAGVVTRGITDWFQARMFELSRGYQGRTGRPTEGLRNGNEWRKALRNELLNWYESRSSLDGGGSVTGMT